MKGSRKKSHMMTEIHMMMMMMTLHNLGVFPVLMLLK